MEKQIKHNNQKLLAWVGIIYVVCVAAAIIYAWANGSHLYDLSLTVSLYVGLYRWTSLLFFLGTTAISALLWLYVRNIKTKPVQKIFYWLIILCTFCCSLFPCNRERSAWISDIHDFFSYALAILVALSFVWMSVFARNAKQLTFGLCSLAYAAAFIVCFALGIDALKATVLIWESLLIVLLFSELILEADSDWCAAALTKGG